MLLPIGPRSPGRALSRRRLLAAGALGALSVATLPGCGPVRFGGPAPYTPPPPGIDDLYRTDLLELLHRALAGADALLDAAPDPELAAALQVLVDALPVQRSALLTGAQAEREQEASSQAPAGDPVPVPEPPADAPTDTAGLVSVLVELRELAADAALQVSGSLARPITAIAARTAWSVRRLHLASGEGEVPALRTAGQLVPAREVPASDQPTIGAEVDYHDTLESTQQEQWYAGYLHEVLAAHAEGEERERDLALAERHRARAEQLGVSAEEDGAAVIPRQAVYALPGGTFDDQLAAQLPTLLAEGLLVDHISLAGAAPFERRTLPIIAAMQEAEVLVDLVTRMQPLPSLEIEDPPPAEGSDGGG